MNMLCYDKDNKPLPFPIPHGQNSKPRSIHTSYAIIHWEKCNMSLYVQKKIPMDSMLKWLSEIIHVQLMCVIIFINEIIYKTALFFKIISVST